MAFVACMDYLNGQGSSCNPHSPVMILALCLFFFAVTELDLTFPSPASSGGARQA